MNLEELNQPVEENGPVYDNEMFLNEGKTQNNSFVENNFYTTTSTKEITKNEEKNSIQKITTSEKTITTTEEIIKTTEETPLQQFLSPTEITTTETIALERSTIITTEEKPTNLTTINSKKAITFYSDETTSFEKEISKPNIILDNGQFGPDANIKQYGKKKK